MKKISAPACQPGFSLPRQTGGAHVFIAEHKNGKTTFIDPQSGKTDVANCFNQAKAESIRYCRIDNLNFSDYIKGCCKRRN